MVKVNSLSLCVPGVYVETSRRARAQKYRRPCTPPHPTRAPIRARTPTHARMREEKREIKRTYHASHSHAKSLTRTHTRTYTHVRVCVCVYACTCTCACTYAHLWACMRVRVSFSARVTFNVQTLIAKAQAKICQRTRPGAKKRVFRG